MKDLIKSALEQAVGMAQRTPQYQNVTKWADTFGVKLPQYQNKIISPIPESENLTNPGLLNYYQQNQMRQEQPYPTTTNYPAFKINQEVANAPKVLGVGMPIATPTPTLTEEQYYRQQKAIFPNADARKIIMDYRQKNTPSPTPTPVSQPFTPTPTTFKYQDAVNQAAKQTGLSLEQFHLLRAGENRAEKPDAINRNFDGTIDVGLYQINVDPRNIAEVERLKDPVYNAMRAGQIFQQRINLLKDPVLAIASYNLGSGGAVLRPLDALKRAQWVYYNAGLPMPETEFTKNPLGYVRKNMGYYKQMGLFRS